MDDASRIIAQLWQLASILGIFFAIWAGMEYPSFDPNTPFFSQPHRWLLMLTWLTNPRALAAYYIFCADPEVAEWFIVFLIGGLLVPGAWGLYYLPGLGADTTLRISLGVVGFLFRDVVENNLIKLNALRAN